MQRPETAGTNLDFYGLSVAHKRLLVYVGKELSLCVAVRVTDIIARHSIL